MNPTFIWYELATGDPQAAQEFYCAVVGWTGEDIGQPGQPYRRLSSHGRGVAGIAGVPPGASGDAARPGWTGYIAVPNTDEAAGGIEAAGGRILFGPADIPGIGRFAAVADPGGARFQLLTPLPVGDMPPAGHRMNPGNVGWQELYAADGDAAFAFYSNQFGWSEAGTFDMGPMGIYRIWTPEPGEEGIGGMMTKPPHAPAPGWTFYFSVDSAEAGAARLTERGGQVLHGPMQVPDGSWVVQAVDPQGAAFALVSRER